MSLILFSWLIALNWTLTMMLNRISEGKYLGLILCHGIQQTEDIKYLHSPSMCVRLKIFILFSTGTNLTESLETSVTSCASPPPWGHAQVQTTLPTQSLSLGSCHQSFSESLLVEGVMRAGSALMKQQEKWERSVLKTCFFMDSSRNSFSRWLCEAMEVGKTLIQSHFEMRVRRAG